jgi:hypothetical protein
MRLRRSSAGLREGEPLVQVGPSDNVDWLEGRTVALLARLLSDGREDQQKLGSEGHQHEPSKYQAESDKRLPAIGVRIRIRLAAFGVDKLRDRYTDAIARATGRRVRFPGHSPIQAIKASGPNQLSELCAIVGHTLFHTAACIHSWTVKNMSMQYPNKRPRLTM